VIKKEDPAAVFFSFQENFQDFPSAIKKLVELSRLKVVS